MIRPIRLRASLPVVATVLLLLLPGGSSAEVDRAKAAQPARIVFVDVGQGDGVVMKVGSKIIVSDAGEFKLKNMNDALRSLDASRIDVAILSHPHQDHVKNFIDLFATWNVKKAVLSKSAYWQGTETNRDVMDAIKDEGLTPTYVRSGQSFSWGGASWQILNPPEGAFTADSSTVAGNASVAYLLRVNRVELLFTGDIETQVSIDVASRLAPNLNGRVEVFLVTHHGSKKGSPKELLDVARPRFAVLSTGPNTHGHPTPEAIARLKAVPATIWCTDVNGSVTARVSASGTLTWSTTGQKAAWWDANTKKTTGGCVEQ